MGLTGHAGQVLIANARKRVALRHAVAAMIDRL
jgi:hypothetical protein